MSLPPSFSRRNFLAFAGIGAVSTLAGCASTVESGPVVSPVQYTGAPASRPFRSWFSSYGGEQPDPAVMYAAVEDGGFIIPPVPYQQIDPQFYRQRVADPTGEAPGTVVVNTRERHLYVTEAGGTAMRYGIGVGREGFAWQGAASSSGARSGRAGTRRTKWSPASRNWSSFPSPMAAWILA